jgi:RNA polymerase sigma-70 factor (ECF subfamily)
LNTETDIVELAEKIRNGNEYAFKELFVEYFQLMVNYSIKFVNDKQIAENIVEDIFVKIWVNRETWIVKKSVKNYLFKATKNC